MRSQSTLAAAFVVALIGIHTTPAVAQHHHHGGGESSSSEGTPAVQIAAGLSVEMGRVEAFGETRDYQGLALMAGARLRSFELGAHVPFYRIELGPQSHAGVGDVHMEAGWIAVERPVEAGVTLALMPPLGSDEYGLAMGHWMIMGGAFARASHGRASGAVSLGYGSTLGGEGHAEHGVLVWPPVAPMNAHEIRGTLQARLALWRTLSAIAQAAAATPIGDGEFLALVGGGLVGQLDRAEVGLDASHGLAAHTAGFVLASRLMFSF